MAINENVHNNLEMDFLNTVGFQFSTIRINKNMSQMDVIKKMESKYQHKISRQHLSDFERGKANITLYESVMLCSIYGISIEEVLIDCESVYKPNRIPPYQKRFKPGMNYTDLSHLAYEMETQLEVIYNQFRNAKR